MCQTSAVAPILLKVKNKAFHWTNVAIQILLSALIMSLTLFLPVLFLAYSIPATSHSLLFVKYHRPRGLLLGYVFSDKHMVNFLLPSRLSSNIIFEMRPILITHVKISTCPASLVFFTLFYSLKITLTNLQHAIHFLFFAYWCIPSIELILNTYLQSLIT